MNLLFISAEFPPAPCGGIGVFYRDLAHEMVRRGHQVTVVAPSDGCSEDSYDSDLAIRRWSGSLSAVTAAQTLIQRLRFTRFAWAAVRELQPDVIETHEWCGPLATAPGRPLVVRLHGSHTVMRTNTRQRPLSAIRLAEGRLLAAADVVVGVSDWIGRETSKAFSIALPSEVISNGVDTEFFRPLPPRRSGQELLFVGTVKPEKGVFELFRALAKVLSYSPELTVHLVGPIAPGVREQLLAMLSESQARRVRFAGAIQRRLLPGLYATATACVLPSLSEAFGLTMAEAMSCGVPVIGSTLGAGPELAQDGQHALLVDPRDAEKLASSILRCLDDAKLRERLAYSARVRACKRFSWSVVAQQNEEFYRGVVQGAHKWPKSA